MGRQLTPPGSADSAREVEYHPVGEVVSPQVVGYSRKKQSVIAAGTGEVPHSSMGGWMEGAPATPEQTPSLTKSLPGIRLTVPVAPVWRSTAHLHTQVGSQLIYQCLASLVTFRWLQQGKREGVNQSHVAAQCS